MGISSVRTLLDHLKKWIEVQEHNIKLEFLHWLDWTCGVSDVPGWQVWASDGPPAELNIMAQSTSIQRVQRLIDSVPLTNLLFTLLSTSYKKVSSTTPRALLGLVSVIADLFNHCKIKALNVFENWQGSLKMLEYVLYKNRNKRRRIYFWTIHCFAVQCWREITAATVTRHIQTSLNVPVSFCKTC